MPLSFDVLEPYDVHDRASYKFLGDAVRIEVDSNIDSVLLDNRRIVVGNIIVGAITQMDSERPKWVGRHQFPQLYWRNHAKNLSSPAGYSSLRLICDIGARTPTSTTDGSDSEENFKADSPWWSFRVIL